MRRISSSSASEASFQGPLRYECIVLNHRLFGFPSSRDRKQLWKDIRRNKIQHLHIFTPTTDSNSVRMLVAFQLWRSTALAFTHSWHFIISILITAQLRANLPRGLGRLGTYRLRACKDLRTASLCARGSNCTQKVSNNVATWLVLAV